MLLSFYLCDSLAGRISDTDLHRFHFGFGDAGFCALIAVICLPSFCACKHTANRSRIVEQRRIDDAKISVYT